MPRLDVLRTLQSREKRKSLLLTVTQDCNLRCRYCYEPHKSRDFYMCPEIARRAIIEHMEADDGFEAMEIDFFGGEPLLAFDLIRNTVDWFHTRRWRKDHIFFISTNGTILSDEMRVWLERNKACVQVGVSLDGNKAAHDLNRSNSYDRVMENLPFFVALWPNQPVKMTISRESIPHVADSIIQLEELGIPFTANVVFEDIWGTPEEKDKLLAVYAEQLDRLVEYYAAHPNLFPARILSVLPEAAIADHRASQVGRDCVRFCGAGHEMAVVEVDGTTSPCHRFSPWVSGKEAPTGPINRQAVWKPEKCDQCRLVGVCPTCAGFNWQINCDTGIRTTFHCEAFKLEILASAKLQAMLLSQRTPKDLADMAPVERYQTKQRVDALFDMATRGV